jgi:hypothetical protein
MIAPNLDIYVFTGQGFVLRFKLVNLHLQLLLLGSALLHPLLHVVHVLLLATPGVLGRNLLAFLKIVFVVCGREYDFYSEVTEAKDKLQLTVPSFQL